jgi:hypothetical protein
MRIWVACSLMVIVGVVDAADAGSPEAAVVVARAFLGERYSIIGSPALTLDDRAIVQVKQGKRACSVTLVRRASVLTGWKISAQDCKASKPKRVSRG